MTTGYCNMLSELQNGLTFTFENTVYLEKDNILVNKLTIQSVKCLYSDRYIEKYKERKK